MRALRSTTLALGLTLTGSLAYAQSNAPIEPRDPAAVREVPQAEAPDEMADPVAPEQQQQEFVDPNVPVGKENIDDQNDQYMKPEEETGAYGTYMAPQPAEQEKGMGLQLMGGGGVFNFTDSDTQDFTSVGAFYTARVGWDSPYPVGFEVAYIGTAQGTEALGLDDDANLISNGVEGVAKVKFLSGNVNPYIIGGAAWKRYDIINEDFNTSALLDEDDVVEFPVGVGVGFNYKKMLIDARGDYRFATNEELIGGSDDTNLDNWSVSLKAGVQF